MRNRAAEIKALLKKRQSREKIGRFVVEGPHLVAEANELIDYFFYVEETPQTERLKADGVKSFKISAKEFAALSEVEEPQNILAAVRQPAYSLASILQAENKLVLFCVEVQDPGNLGTIVRTADAAGAGGVILSKGTVDLYNSKVVRGTMGSLFHLPVVRVEETAKVIEQLKRSGFRVIAADLKSEKSCFEADLTKPTVILVGNEGNGLPREVLKLADETVTIPMPGQAESLNVAISSAIILYEALRQRGDRK